MKSQFFDLVDALYGELSGDEVLLCSLSAERSDFVRFNRSLVRQAGSVTQSYLSLRLARERRQAAASIALAGNDDDFALARSTLARLRGAAAWPVALCATSSTDRACVRMPRAKDGEAGP